MWMYWSEFLAVVVFFQVALMSPGPDFLLVSRNSVVYGRKIGFWTGVGVSLGILVHITYSLIGVGILLSKSILLYSIVKYLGAAYLIYLGVKSLRSQGKELEVSTEGTVGTLSAKRALLQGFLTDALNPKTTLLFLSLFTQVIHVRTPVPVVLAYAATMVGQTVLWFAVVATCFGHQWVQQHVRRVQKVAMRVTGGLLIAFGIKVALSRD